MTEVFILHFASTLFMTGLVWMVQIVHYPLFKQIRSEQFIDYESRHSKLITFIVAPVMSIELVSGIVLAISNYLDGPNYNLFFLSFIFLVLIWLSTIFIQIPQHRKLGAGYNALVIDKLVSYNWIRTISWSLRTLILIYIIYDLP